MNTPAAKTATAGAPLLKRVRGEGSVEEPASLTYSGLATPVCDLPAYTPPPSGEEEADEAVCRTLFHEPEEPTREKRLAGAKMPSIAALRSTIWALPYVKTADCPYAHLRGEPADVRYLFCRALDESVHFNLSVVAYWAAWILDGSHDEYIRSHGEEYAALIREHRSW
jgi:hypothetical protein